MVIHPVTLSESDSTVSYVVEVPQSTTAHMARDHRYYKRQNFNVLLMEDYEVRDVMNRRRHPELRVSIYVNRHTHEWNEGLLLVKLENVSPVIAREFVVDLEVPSNLEGEVFIEDAFFEERDSKNFYAVRLRQSLRKTPLFPGSEIILRQKFNTNVSSTATTSRKPLPSTDTLFVTVFADETPASRGQIKADAVLNGWTVVIESTLPVPKS